MITEEQAASAVQIGVFAAEGGWLLTHPDVQSRFDDREEALAAARRLAHLEAWRGKVVDVTAQDALGGLLAHVDLH